MSETGTITGLLHQLSDGQDQALEQLMPLIYNELRQLAQWQLRNERADHTLNPTALVNEVYEKLVHQDKLLANHRNQFMGIAARTMRRILVDYARSRKRIKRGGKEHPVPFEESIHVFTEREADELIALNDALDLLSTINKRACDVVVQRFYTGLSMEEIALFFGVSVKTVQRDWLMARAWLRKEVSYQMK